MNICRSILVASLLSLGTGALELPLGSIAYAGSNSLVGSAQQLVNAVERGDVETATGLLADAAKTCGGARKLVIEARNRGGLTFLYVPEQHLNHTEIIRVFRGVNANGIINLTEIAAVEEVVCREDKGGAPEGGHN